MEIIFYVIINYIIGGDLWMWKQKILTRPPLHLKETPKFARNRNWKYELKRFSYSRSGHMRTAAAETWQEKTEQFTKSSLWL